MLYSWGWKSHIEIPSDKCRCLSNQRIVSPPPGVVSSQGWQRMTSPEGRRTITKWSSCAMAIRALRGGALSPRHHHVDCVTAPCVGLAGAPATPCGTRLVIYLKFTHRIRCLQDAGSIHQLLQDEDTQFSFLSNRNQHPDLWMVTGKWSVQGYTATLTNWNWEGESFGCKFRVWLLVAQN